MRDKRTAGARLTAPILATKLHIPQLRSSLVPRPGLVTRLAEGLARPLIVLSAPAGFGKTTLVSEWIAHTPGLPVAWLSLDEDDNDPARFLAYLISALNTLKPGVGTAALDLLASPQSPPTKSVLATLANSLATLPDDFVLVLDDYHVLTESAVQAALTYLLDHQPAQMHLVVLSRADPPLPLARLRARGQLLELRAADLRFTPDEAIAFLNQTMKLGLTTAGVMVLEAETEGWIAGLQLAALCLAPSGAGAAGTQEPDDASAFIAAFTGSNRFVLDYLVEEVLARQPAQIQRFLLQTAILDQFCAPLCAAVVEDDQGVPAAQAILETLERLNLFIIPLDHERRWYRYHHLFAEFLRSNLLQAQPALLPELHRRAAGWYEQHGFPYEAVGHALDAKDWERAARLIESIAQDVLMRSQVATLIGWLDALPRELLRRRPSLSMFYVWALVITGGFTVVESLLADTELFLQSLPDGSQSEAETAGRASLQAQVYVARGLLSIYSGIDVSHQVDLARQALSDLPEVDPFLRGLMALLTGLAAYLGSDMASASHAFDESIEISQATGNLVTAQMAVYGAGYQQIFQGHLHRAAETFERGLRLAKASSGSGQLPPMASVVYQGLGEVRREWNDLDGAERDLLQAFALGEQLLRSPELLIDGHITLARLHQARGDLTGAMDALEPAREWVQGGKVSIWTVRQVLLYQARLQIAQGDLLAGMRWAEAFMGTRQGAPTNRSLASVLIDSLEDLTLARLWIAQGRHAEATHLLRALLARMVSSDWRAITLEALILLALALGGQGEGAQAMARLQTSLMMAEPEGYARIYLDEGAPMAGLLARLVLGRGVPAEQRHPAVVVYASRLLEQFSPQLPPAEPLSPPHLVPTIASVAIPVPLETTDPVTSLIEPLSEREREVLALVAAGFSTREIAARLVITDGTVKRHVNNIHNKLNVHSRTQAIARARALHIIQ